MCGCKFILQIKLCDSVLVWLHHKIFALEIYVRIELLMKVSNHILGNLTWPWLIKGCKLISSVIWHMFNVLISVLSCNGTEIQL